MTAATTGTGGSPVPAPVPAGGTPAAAPRGGRELVGGGAVLGLAMIVANAGNYALNLVLGRWLGPAEFSDANLMVTLMLTVASAALCLQMVAARFVAAADEAGDPDRADRIAHRLRRWALVGGIATGVLLAAPAAGWARLFQTGSAWPFVLLGAGMPCYLLQSVGRGVMQGRLRFRPLAATFVVEMAVRLVLGIALVAAGAGVLGATAALTASFVATWLAVRLLGGTGGTRAAAGGIGDVREVRRYAGTVSVLLVGQILANNTDVLVAKAFFAPAEAGVYSAVALVGRAVFFLAWSVATVLFPAAARRHSSGGHTGGLLRGGSLAVLAIGALCTAGAALVGGPVLGVVLGPDYAHVSGPLAGYAAMTTLFAVANLVASHDLSRGRLGTSVLVLAGAAVQLVFLLVRHADIGQLIAGQTVAMALTLLAVAVAARSELFGRHGQHGHDHEREVAAA
ncbi:oligosaccharide flippase family protein [Nakamurella endophytica]|uniref:O-antigen/teichoic acid export membrane protein n=1 Tax=Nakamurella endophytica TaxID=1748367 RepID=A0A917T367_9ACTN|nr:oligosaccharide flippase family protein [Nakamurella endophytica]GGM08963.1 hypothetical protein GCM10011594_31060 [Nakamurella endophytica]